MTPEGFYILTLASLVPPPFTEQRFKPEITASVLNIDDPACLEKARVSAISMVLFMTHLAISDTYSHQFRPDDLSREVIEENIVNSYATFRSILTNVCQRQQDLPGYANVDYFIRWKRRYEEALLASPDTVKHTTISLFFKQATFHYGDEPRVDASDDLIIFWADNVFDNCLMALRDFLGYKVLA